MKRTKINNAFFYQRLFAYIIDILLITSVSSLFSLPFTNSNVVNELSNESVNIVDKYVNKEISTKKYLSSSIGIAYDLACENGVSTIITLILLVLYFIVFQFYNFGQTIGKKIMKIKVVSSDFKPLTMNSFIIRSLIIDFIFVDMLIFLFVILGNKNSYYYASSIFEGIQYIVVFISSIMILYKNNGQGLHDILARTKVVKLNEVEEEREVCVN